MEEVLSALVTRRRVTRILGNRYSPYYSASYLALSKTVLQGPGRGQGGLSGMGSRV